MQSNFGSPIRDNVQSRFQGLDRAGVNRRVAAILGLGPWHSPAALRSWRRGGGGRPGSSLGRPDALELSCPSISSSIPNVFDPILSRLIASRFVFCCTNPSAIVRALVACFPLSNKIKCSGLLGRRDESRTSVVAPLTEQLELGMQQSTCDVVGAQFVALGRLSAGAGFCSHPWPWWRLQNAADCRHAVKVKIQDGQDWAFAGCTTSETWMLLALAGTLQPLSSRCRRGLRLASLY